jgi:hypothetical protein
MQFLWEHYNFPLSYTKRFMPLPQLLEFSLSRFGHFIECKRTETREVSIEPAAPVSHVRDMRATLTALAPPSTGLLKNSEKRHILGTQKLDERAKTRVLLYDRKYAGALCGVNKKYLVRQLAADCNPTSTRRKK